MLGRLRDRWAVGGVRGGARRRGRRSSTPSGAARPAAARRIYHRYKRRVFALALRIVGAVDAEEVAQEAFIRVFRGLPKFRGDAALGTWIYRLAVNAALSHRSRRGATCPRRRRAIPRCRARPRWSRGRRRGDLALRAQLERALAALPVGYRTVIVLHDVEGLEHEEVASDPRLPRRHVEVAAAQGARQAARDPRRQDGITSSELRGALT